MDRDSLEGPPRPTEQPAPKSAAKPAVTPARRDPEAQARHARPGAPPPPRDYSREVGSSLDFNRPVIVCLLYLGTFFTGFTFIIGLFLAYFWKKEPGAEWQVSHFSYLIRTVWYPLLYFFGGIFAIAMLSTLAEQVDNGPGEILVVILMVPFGLVVLASFFLGTARTIVSLVNALGKKPMRRPKTWLI
jgi:uncharacterized membrane protein